MSLVRKIKISKLLNKPLSDKDNEILLFVENWIKGLVLLNQNIYSHTSFYFNKDGKSVIEINVNTNTTAWVREKDFWNILSWKYLLEYREIQKIILYVINQHFDKKIDGVFPLREMKTDEGEKIYKNIKEREKSIDCISISVINGM